MTARAQRKCWGPWKMTHASILGLVVGLLWPAAMEARLAPIHPQPSSSAVKATTAQPLVLRPPDQAIAQKASCDGDATCEREALGLYQIGVRAMEEERLEDAQQHFEEVLKYYFDTSAADMADKRLKELRNPRRKRVKDGEDAAPAPTPATRLEVFADPLAPRGADLEMPPFRIGLGTGMNLANLLAPLILGDEEAFLYPISFTNLHIPVYLEQLRLEPEVGVLNSYQSGDYTDENGNVSQELRQRYLRLATTASYAFKTDRKTLLYAGLKFGLLRRFDAEASSATADGDTSSDELITKWTDLSIGPVAGGEYGLSEHFSLGLELQAIYTRVGSPKQSGSSSEGTTSDTSSVYKERYFSNNMLLFLRFYFR